MNGVIAYIIPTRDRAERLSQTLDGLARLAPHDGEVIVVDNASGVRPDVPARLTNGLTARVIALNENHGAAARNIGVREANAPWVVMLDDDSCPAGTGFIERLRARPGDVAAVMADIHLPRKGCRESGGLPEVFIGCGVAIRREAFLEAGGYDPAFGYYAEEYDLAARLLMAGRRIEFDADWRVDHQKDDRNRDMNLILGRLIRNNGWVMQRWAPNEARRGEIRHLRRRYRAIAEKERALAGFADGLTELRRTLPGQARRPMSRGVWDRFTGLSAAREALQAAWRTGPFRTATVVEEGKNSKIVRAVLAELGVREVIDHGDAEALVIGTMSPGPMLDAVERWNARGVRLVAPWMMACAKARMNAA